MATITATTFKPLGIRILVRREEDTAKTAGGLYLPDNAQEKSQRAVVVTVGTGGRDDQGRLIEFSVKEGDLVLISKYGGGDITLNGEDFVIISESDILGIIS